TGEKPFVADHLPSLLYRIVREDPVPPQRLNPTLGPQVETVLRKALSKNSTERFTTCVEFVDALASACNANPGWRPLPRATAQTMPTIGGGAAIDHTSVRAPSPKEPEPVPALPIVEPRQPQRDDMDSANPLLKSLVWMLVGIGLVGLVLFGAQKFLFNRSAEPTAAPVEVEAQKPASPGRSADATAKPSPVGEPRGPDETAKTAPKTDNPPVTTTPESTAGDTPPRDTPPRETPRREVSIIPPPVTAPKSGPEQTVQFLTDPPGAQIAIDGNSSLACKTPCM